MASRPLLHSVQEEERQGPLSRKTSYGTFLPFYRLDVKTLLQQLPPEEEQAEEIGRNTPPSPDKTESNSLQREEVKNTVKGARKDSAYGDDSLERKREFLASCSVQFELLFQFVKEQLDRVRMDFNRRFTRVSEKRLLPIDINGDPGFPREEKKERSMEDSASFLGDSGIEEDRIASPKSFLQNLWSVLESLLHSMQNTMRSLDELLGMYDTRTQTTEGADLVKEQRAKASRFEIQLREEMDMIDSELHSLNGKRRKDGMSEEDVLAMAKKQRFSVRHSAMFLLLVATASAVVYFAAACTHSKWTVFMRLVRSPLFIAYYCFLVGFNIMSWARVDINYIRLFKFPAGGRPTPKLMFNIGSMLTVIFSILVFLFLFLSHYAFYIADKVIAIIMWGILLLFLLNPFDMFLRRGRFSFLLVQIRILLAPLVKVLFSDIWFADQLNSLVALIVDVQYLFCYIICSPWTTLNSTPPDLNDCSTSNTGIRPILFCMPALWRFFQCLRSFHDTRKVGHLINAGKYSTTFFVVISAAFYSIRVKASMFDFNAMSGLEWSGWLILSLTFSSALLNALYCFAWDVLQDWHLCRCSERCPRYHLLYQKPWYFLAIVFDFVVRIGNALKLILGVAYYVDSDLFFTALVLAEITRRFVWNFFRVEWEQVNTRPQPAQTLDC